MFFMTFMPDSLEILHFDKDKAVAIKPVGVSSEGDEGMPGIVQKALLEKGVKCTVFPLHRLDTAVGGVMIFALNKSYAAKMSAEIAQNNLKKEYLAVIHGCPEEKNGVFKDLLFKDSRKNKSFIVNRMRKGVKEASLEYSVLEEQGGLSLVRILLHTGRTHQIRVQFSGRKMPLFADGKYGGKENGNIGLFSHRLTLPDGQVFEALPKGGKPWDNFEFLK